MDWDMYFSVLWAMASFYAIVMLSNAISALCHKVWRHFFPKPSFALWAVRPGDLDKYREEIGVALSATEEQINKASQP